ncbi:protein DDB G0276689-like [Aphis craccivora]|uniref:Protein DDB G0276689-like n=1 Tax=Aphis craccivora TaxID=307492 RepID=A0A6G0VTG8_APHCR|nr:protein DDB G0276689-like [Aphis craccivora]
MITTAALGLQAVRWRRRWGYRGGGGGGEGLGLGPRGAKFCDLKNFIINEYINKFMNKDKEENNFSEHEKKVSETTQEYIKEIYSDNTKGKSLLDTTFRDDLSTRVEPRVLGLRSTQNIVHTELGPVRRKQRTKMSSVKATIEQVTAMIPMCADAKDVCSFIRACDYACEAVDKESIPLLVKFINTRITGKALEVGRFRETSDWETIKKILRGTFEQQ